MYLIYTEKSNAIKLICKLSMSAVFDVISSYLNDAFVALCKEIKFKGNLVFTDENTNQIIL